MHAAGSCWTSHQAKPKLSSLGLLSIHSPPSLHLCLGLPWPMGRTLTLALLNFMRYARGPPLSPVQVPRDGIPSLQHVNHTTQLGVIGNLAEGALSPTVHAVDKDVKQRWSQYWPLKNTTPHWSSLGHQAVYCDFVCATIQSIPYPPSGASIRSMSLHFRDKDVVQDSVKCFAQVQVDDVSCSSLL